MPVVFVIDPALPKDVKTITLSYTFFEVDGNKAAVVVPVESDGQTGQGSSGRLKQWNRTGNVGLNQHQVGPRSSWKAAFGALVGLRRRAKISSAMLRV